MVGAEFFFVFGKWLGTLEMVEIAIVGRGIMVPFMIWIIDFIIVYIG